VAPEAPRREAISERNAGGRVRGAPFRARYRFVPTIKGGGSLNPPLTQLPPQYPESIPMR